MAGARRSSWVWLVFVALIGALLISASVFVIVRVTAPLPAATVRVQAPATLLVDRGAPPPIPLPVRGSTEVATSANGTVASRNPVAVRPIGSVAKAMTALV